jgi:hypothetical protein
MHRPGSTAPNHVSWVLRIGVAMEFVGHGVLGLHHPPAWASYFGVVGIPRQTALMLMPLVGAFDVATALTVLFYPIRGVLLFMAAWGLWTALLRPLAGESAWEAVERAGNFGAPLALFLVAQCDGPRSWLRFNVVHAIGGELRTRFSWLLRLTTVLLLAGHGALGLLVHKPMFHAQYASIGLPSAWVEPLIGGFELVLALAVLVRPEFRLLVFVLVWKLATEALSPMTGSPIWVFIEHGGSYAAPLALALLCQPRVATRPIC